MSDFFSSCVIVDDESITVKSLSSKEENPTKPEESNKDKEINDILSNVLNEKAQLAESVMSEGESHFIVEHCSFCNVDLLKDKYKCLVCDNVIMCSQCEENHFIEHPSLKIKTNTSIVRNNEDIYNYYYSNKKNLNPLISSSHKKILLSTKSNSKLFINLQKPLTLSFDILNKGKDKDNNFFVVKNNKDYVIDIDDSVILFNEKGKCKKEVKISMTEETKSKVIKLMFFVYNTMKKEFMSNIISIEIKQSDDKENYDDFDIIGMSEIK